MVQVEAFTRKRMVTREAVEGLVSHLSAQAHLIAMRALRCGFCDTRRARSRSCRRSAWESGC